MLLLAALVGAVAPPKSFLQKAAVVRSHKENSTAYERDLPTPSTFFDKSHETVAHIRTDLKDFYKTVGSLRSADLEEGARLEQSYVSLLHRQEDEVKHQMSTNAGLVDDNAAITKENKALAKRKQAMITDNSALEQQLKELKSQVEQEVDGLEGLLDSKKASLAAVSSKQDKDDDVDDDDDASDDDATPAAAAAKGEKAPEAADDADDDADDDDDDASDDTAALVQKDDDDKKDKTDDDDDASDDDKAALVASSSTTEEACRCTSGCTDPDDENSFCFVQSPTCTLPTSCSKGAKGDACIKLDPKKGAWTLCSNIHSAAVNATAKGPLLPENPSSAAAVRMLATLQKEILEITAEDEKGADRMRAAYEEQAKVEKKKRRQVMKRQKQLQDAKKELQSKKAKLSDEVHHLEEVNTGLHRQVDRFGQFLSKESAKLKDAVAPAAVVAPAPA